MPSVEKRGDKWLLTAYLGYDNKGKQIRPRMIVEEKITKPEAKKRAGIFEDEMRRLQNKGIDIDITFGDFVKDIWQPRHEIKLSPTVQDNNKLLFDRINPSFEHRPLREIKPVEIIDFYDWLKTEKNKKTGKPLSSRRVEMHHKLLNSILNKAVKWEYLNRNPVMNVDAPRSKSEKRPILQEDDLSRFLLLLVEHAPVKYQLFYLIALTTGLRRGELLALKWSNVSLDKRTITINESLYRDQENKGIKTKETKTEASDATLIFPEILVDYFKKQKADTAKAQLVAGSTWQKKDLVFPNETGTYIYPSTPGHWLEKFLKRHDLPKITNHSFRHMSVTYSLAQGFDLKSVSSRARHQQLSTTTDIYGHYLESKDKAIANAMNSLLESVLNKK